MIEIHTLGWKGDHAVEVGEEPNVTIWARVFVDGTEIPQVSRVRTFHRQDLTLCTITLIGPVTVVNHDEASWDALPKEQP